MYSRTATNQIENNDYIRYFGTKGLGVLQCHKSMGYCRAPFTLSSYPPLSRALLHKQTRVRTLLQDIAQSRFIYPKEL